MTGCEMGMNTYLIESNSYIRNSILFFVMVKEKKRGCMMYKSIGIVAAAFMLTACMSEASDKNEEKPVQTEQTTQTEKEPAVTQDHEK